MAVSVHEQPKYKIVLIGDLCLVPMSQLATNGFSQLGSKPYPIEIDSNGRTCRIKHAINGETIVLEIIQVHEESNSEIRDEYIKSADGILLVYSSSYRESFEATKKYHSLILKLTSRSSFPMFLVSPICEALCSTVDHEEGKKLAEKLKMSFMVMNLFFKNKDTENSLCEIVQSIVKFKSLAKLNDETIS